MQKWEYLFVTYQVVTPDSSSTPLPFRYVKENGKDIHLPAVRQLFDYFNQLGSQGWEYVETLESHDSRTNSSHLYLFKRLTQE